MPDYSKIRSSSSSLGGWQLAEREFLNGTDGYKRSDSASSLISLAPSSSASDDDNLNDCCEFTPTVETSNIKNSTTTALKTITENIPVIQKKVEKLDTSIGLLRAEIRKLHKEIHELREDQWENSDSEYVNPEIIGNKQESIALSAAAAEPSKREADYKKALDSIGNAVNSNSKSIVDGSTNINELWAIFLIVCTPAVCGLVTSLICKILDS